MRWPRTLSLYVAREIGLFAGLSFFAVSVVLISQQLLERLDQLVSLGVGRTDLPGLLGFIVSGMATHAGPIAFAFGATLTVGRLATNSEILAIRSLGVGLGALFAPALAIAALISAGTAHLIAEVEPQARLGLRQSLADVAMRGSIVQGGRFRGAQDRVIYTDSRSDDGELRGVMIHDHTDPLRPFVTFAEAGSLGYDATTGVLRLVLRSGQILVDPDEAERTKLVSFDRFEYAFEALSLLRGRYGARNTDELTSNELVEVLGQIDRGDPLLNLRRPERHLYVLELERRRAMPLASLWFALLAVGFGAGRRRTRALSLVACATGAFTYYAATTLFLQLGADQRLDPVAAAWAPNAIFALTGASLAWRTSRSAGE